MLLIIGGIIMAAVVSLLIIRASKRKNQNQQTPAPTNVQVRLPLLTNSQVFYAPTLVADNKLLVPLLTNEQVFYGASVSREAALIVPLLTNTQSFFAPKINQSLTVPLLTNEQTFYGPQVSADDRLTLSLLTNTQTFYEPSINQHVIVPLLTNAQEFYGVTVLRDTALDVPLLTNTQTFYQAAIRQNINLPRLTNTNGFFPITVAQPGLPGFALTTPTVVVISDAGDPPEVTLTINSDHYAGFYLDIERSTASAKNASDGSYVTKTLNISHQITPSELAALEITNAALTPDGYTNPTGAYFQQYRIRREDGALSAWVEISGTVTTSAATLHTVNGLNKSRYLTVSPSTPLQFAGTSGVGAMMGARSTIEAQSDYTQFEVTVTAQGVNAGWCNATDNFDAAFPTPGKTTANGIAIETGQNRVAAYWNNASGQQVLSTAINSVLPDDVLTLRIKKSTRVGEVYRTRGEETVQLGSNITGLPVLSSHYAWVGTSGTGAGTCNFGATSFAKELDNGAAIHG